MIYALADRPVPATFSDVYGAPQGPKREGGENPPRTRRRDGWLTPVSGLSPPRPLSGPPGADGKAETGDPKPEDLPWATVVALTSRA